MAKSRLCCKPAFLRSPFTGKSGFAWRGKGTNHSPWKRHIMEEKFQQLQALFGKEKPNVKVFRSKLAKLPKRRQPVVLRDTYLLALGYWKELPRDYRRFLMQLIRNNRQDWVDFLHGETILGELRYTIQRPKLFFAMMRIIELSERTRYLSVTSLSMNVLTVFNCLRSKGSKKDYSVKIKTLSENFQKAVVNVKSVMLLIGKFKSFEDVYDE